MTVANFFQAVSIVLIPDIRGNPQDLANKARLWANKKSPTAVLNMGKRFAGVKNDDLADLQKIALCS